MLDLVQVLTILFVAVTMALALAHALELPGKMRLSKDTYYAMQPIYYPGFTIGGFAEPVGLILTIILLFLTPSGTADFWLILAALFGLIGMPGDVLAVYAPGEQVLASGSKNNRPPFRLFSFGANRSRPQNETRSAHWTDLRNQWEYSHVARAGLALASLTALVIAVSQGS